MIKKTERKKEILKNSIELMYLKGYNGTSVKDITDAAGIPKGSFYNYFADKEQYAVDALDYYYNVMQCEHIGILSDPKLKPIQRISTFYKKGIHRLCDTGFIMGCFAGNLSEEMGDVSELIGKAAYDFHNRIVKAVYENLLEAQELGELRTSLDLNVLAGFIESSWQGAMLRMKSAKKDQALREFYTILTDELLK